MATKKLINFNDDEENTLLKYVNERGGTFSAYVKELIRKDKEVNQDRREEIKNIIKEVLKDQNISLEPLSNVSESVTIDSDNEDYNNALMDILGQH